MAVALQLPRLRLASNRRPLPAMDWSDSLWLTCALVLVFEGFMPFVAPALWRRTFLQIAQMRDGQIRFFALCSILAGLLMLVWA